MLDDYTKAEFPLDLVWKNGGCMVRLYGVIGKRVIGASFRTYQVDGETFEDFGQSLDWDGQGIFGSDPIAYASMHLPPPPAKIAEKVAELQDRIASAQGRLDGMPDAPQEWRSIDERMIERAKAQIAFLQGDA